MKHKMKKKLDMLYAGKLGDPARLGQYLVRLLSDARVPLAAKLKLAGSGLYGLIERDLLSDSIKFIPGVGMVDDLVLVVHGVRLLIGETDTEVAVELWPGDEASFKRTMKIVVWLDDLLYGNVRKSVLGLLSKAKHSDRLVPWNRGSVK